MRLENVSDKDLLDKVDRLVTTERELTIEVVLHLREVYRRKLHRELGYSSMFEYATKRLKYSESSASRRIRSARVIDEFPEILELLKSGELSICVLSQIAKSLTVENKDALIKEVLGKSRREVEVILAAKGKPKAKVERIRPVMVKTQIQAIPSESLDLFSTTTGGCESKETVEPEPELCHEFLFTADKELFDLVSYGRKILSGKYPHGVSLEDLFKEALTDMLNKRCPKKRQKRREARKVKKPVETKSDGVKPRSRAIPAGIRDQVFVRDGGRCSFEAGGTRCNCTHDLELHHIKPFARGGEHRLENLKLVCRVHNIYLAEQDYGREVMALFGKG